MIDVCPVGALTDKTFRFKSRVWFNKPFNAHRECTHQDVEKTTVWMFGNEIQRVTGRKDVYHEVEELFVILVVLTTKIQLGLLKDQENSICYQPK
jgi:NADH dehydrogenase/NADH:ubiquinone oxidoreductase subunit G